MAPLVEALRNWCCVLDLSSNIHARKRRSEGENSYILFDNRSGKRAQVSYTITPSVCTGRMPWNSRITLFAFDCFVFNSIPVNLINMKWSISLKLWWRDQTDPNAGWTKFQNLERDSTVSINSFTSDKWMAVVDGPVRSTLRINGEVDFNPEPNTVDTRTTCVITRPG